ncbi:conserved hypothetical protein [delta proteobacterium NaphS2]|nr:conserved hypothetical protein [delta proteobacterium NaphS2]
MSQDFFPLCDICAKNIVPLLNLEEQPVSKSVANMRILSAVHQKKFEKLFEKESGNASSNGKKKLRVPFPPENLDDKGWNKKKIAPPVMHPEGLY